MDSRYSKLLHELIIEYISTAEPVGSVRLQEQAGFTASSATIRSMLRDLEEEGYIEQPHTSAGRIPTDKGYRWYVNKLIVRDLNERRMAALAEQYHNLAESSDASMPSAVKLLSGLTKTLAASGRTTGQGVYEFGLSRLFDQPEGEDIETVREVTNITDTLDDHITEFVEQARNEVVVYIGEENPAYNAKYTSVLARTVTLPDGEEAVLLVLGPKRMPYARHMPLLEAMASIMSNK
ncbi:MAG: hypothetical protein HYR90_04650 [Candidatus Andersenbacteria bacterium]|nr:hypothetical protein [Candidatus Andersenbacteria bacterium]MBI3250438.1 hypothetical protein [Candidatus Andersenbacteria bacterium]